MSPGVTARALLDADEVRVERLATFWSSISTSGCANPRCSPIRAVSPASASAPITTVTSSESSSTNSSSSAIAASAADFVATQMPSRVDRDPVAGGDRARTRPTLSRTACVTSPACTRSAASSIAAAFSSSDASASYTTSAASASTTAAVGTTATGRSVSSGTCRATGTMFLLFGSTITPSAAHALHRVEDLRGRRVHRLTAGDDLLHTEAREQLARGRRPPRPRRPRW